MSAQLRLFCGDDPPPSKPKQPRPLPRPLRWPDALTLIAWCAAEIGRYTCPRKIAAAKRDEMIVNVGLYFGLRVSEICKLLVTHIDLHGKGAFIERSKGGKDRLVTIPSKLVDMLRTWIGTRQDGFLIPDYDGGMMSDRTIRWRLTRAAKLAGIPVNVHPHKLRHSYASHLLNTGANIRTVQALLGHADIQTTAYYLDVDPSRFQSDVDRL